MFQFCRRLSCALNHKDVFLRAEKSRLAKWKYIQHLKQASASAKLKASYELGLNRLVSSGSLSTSEMDKWKGINDRAVALQRETKELLWYSRRRISRDFASSEEGLGKYPKTE